MTSGERRPELHVMTLNLYNGQYLEEAILPHLEKTQPDVFLAQEVFDEHRQRIRNALGSTSEYFSLLCPLSLDHGLTPPRPWGIAIFARKELTKLTDFYYKGNPLVFEPNLTNAPADHRSIVSARVEAGGETFNVATTHFTYPLENGKVVNHVTSEQLMDFVRLAGFLDSEPEMILGGDFNTPRGGKIFDTLATRLTDNVPKQLLGTYDDTIQPEAVWDKVIDGLFTSEHYRAKRVSITNGLSDHVAVEAWVEKVRPA